MKMMFVILALMMSTVASANGVFVFIVNGPTGLHLGDNGNSYATLEECDAARRSYPRRHPGDTWRMVAVCDAVSLSDDGKAWNY